MVICVGLPGSVDCIINAFIILKGLWTFADAGSLHRPRESRQSTAAFLCITAAFCHIITHQACICSWRVRQIVLHARTNSYFVALLAYCVVFHQKLSRSIAKTNETGLLRPMWPESTLLIGTVLFLDFWWTVISRPMDIIAKLIDCAESAVLLDLFKSREKIGGDHNKIQTWSIHWKNSTFWWWAFPRR